MKYLETIREIVVYLNVSDGKMEEGSLRCDVNISLNKGKEFPLGMKVEAKNINSINNIGIALDYEIKRQSEMLDNNEKILQETRRYDDSIKGTKPMRLKSDAVDYRYFVEPNIMPIKLTNEFISGVIETADELASEKRKRYINEFKLSEYDTTCLLTNKSIAIYFDECAKLTSYHKSLVNWIMGDIISYLNKELIEVDQFPIAKDNLIKLITMVEKKELSNTQAKKIFSQMLINDNDPEEIKAELGISSQENNEDQLLVWVNEVLDENPQSIIDIKQGKDRALGFLVGQTMKKSRGKANPAMTSKIINEELKKR